MAKTVAIGNTHFDPVWLWTWDESLTSIRATFRSALDRMDEEPEFCYSFSCPPVFEWVRETDPELFAAIKRRAADGRWKLDEAMWLQPDLYSAQGESYIRQCLHGQMYLRENFGVVSDTAFNIDSFGHSPMLPQIYAKCGVKYGVISRPDTADVAIPSPLFTWESPDGSRVEMFRINDGINGWSRDIESELDAAEKRADELGHPVMLVFGVTDHGGAPTKRDIAAIKRRASARFGGVRDYFESVSDAARPVVKGELLVKHFGPYANFPEIKSNNRRAEYSLYNAERAAVLARELSGKEYPMERLRAACRDMLFNQFHDILGGASIIDAYRDARDLHGRSIQTSAELLHTSLQSIGRRIDLSNRDCPEAAWNAVVWNLNTAPYRGLVAAEAQWVWEFDFHHGGIAVIGPDGAEQQCQIVTPRESIPGFRTRFLFEAEVPAMGYAAYRIVRRGDGIARADAGCSDNSDPESFGGGMTVSDCAIENRYIRAEFGGCGLSRVVDKRTGRVIEGCSIPAALRDESDVWAFNFTGYGAPERFDVRAVRVIESGPLRARVRVESVYRDSRLTQDFTLARDSEYIDAECRVDWNERQRTLKLSFGKRADESVTADAPYCAVKRPSDGVEYPSGEWLDCRSASGEGYTVAPRGTFAYDSTDGELRLTVLRSPVVGDLRITPLEPDKYDYEYLGTGVTRFGWRLSFRGGNPTANGEFAAEWANPPIVDLESNHGGELPLSNGFIACEGADVTVTAVKPAESGRGIVVRMINASGEPRTAGVTLFGNRRSPELRFGPHEIKTLAVGDDFTETDMLEN